MVGKPKEAPAEGMLFFEERVHCRGFQRVAGIDEVGRGPLAGPVVAAAVVLPPGAVLAGVRDSKALTPRQREVSCDTVLSCAEDVGIGVVEAETIDRINILQATFRAMLSAVEQLKHPPQYLLIDGPYRLPTDLPQEGIPKGDRLSLSIAAASIVAKVYRDRLLHEYHQLYPMYGFDRNKGYGTAEHLAALREYGPCPVHRLSFRGVLAPRGDGRPEHGDASGEG